MIKRERFALMDFGQRPLDTKIDLLLLICQINISKHSDSDKLSTTAEAFRSLKFLASRRAVQVLSPTIGPGKPSIVTSSPAAILVLAPSHTPMNPG